MEDGSASAPGCCGPRSQQRDRSCSPEVSAEVYRGPFLKATVHCAKDGALVGCRRGYKELTFNRRAADVQAEVQGRALGDLRERAPCHRRGCIPYTKKLVCDTRMLLYYIFVAQRSIWWAQAKPSRFYQPHQHLGTQTHMGLNMAWVGLTWAQRLPSRSPAMAGPSNSAVLGTKATSTCLILGTQATQVQATVRCWAQATPSRSPPTMAGPSKSPAMAGPATVRCWAHRLPQHAQQVSSNGRAVLGTQAANVG